MNNEKQNIYFSNYMIGQGSTEKFSNEVQLKVLLLLSNRVLIPPTHFLKMSNRNLEELGEFKDFFDKGYICTTLYQGFEQVTDYLKFKVENDQGYINTYRYRLDKLERFFESENSICRAKDSKQGGEFSSILLDQIEEYKHLVNNTKLEKEIDNEEKLLYELLSNSSKGFLYKAEVEKEIKELNHNKKISRRVLNDSFIIINRSYLLAGAVSNESILSFSSYYDEIGLPLEYGNRQISNLVYSTGFFVMVLKALGIVDSVEEFNKLSVNDILQLKNRSEFQKFIKEYRKFCLIVDGSDSDVKLYESSVILSNKQKHLIWWNRLSKCLIALAALPIDIVTGLLDGGNPIPVYSLAVICIEAFCSQSKIEKIFDKNIVDRISTKVSKRVDVFSHFCLLLKDKITEI